jgi:hypothetical protein
MNDMAKRRVHTVQLQRHTNQTLAGKINVLDIDKKLRKKGRASQVIASKKQEKRSDRKRQERKALLRGSAD